MFRNNGGSRKTLYITGAVVIVVGVLLVYGLTHAITQATLALIAGTMLLVGNGPEVVRTLRGREFGLAMMNALVGIALLSFFLVKWLGPLFYVPLIGALVLAAPLTLNRLPIARAYLNAVKNVAVQATRLVRSSKR